MGMPFVIIGLTKEQRVLGDQLHRSAQRNVVAQGKRSLAELTVFRDIVEADIEGQEDLAAACKTLI